MVVQKPLSLKFAVVGLVGAGATTFIRAVSEAGDLPADLPLIKLGLLPRAQNQWDIVLADKTGILVMVDSTKPTTFPEVVILMHAVSRVSSAPLIVIANKQDHPAALKPDVIRTHLKLGAHVPVIPCVAKDKDSIRRVLMELADHARSKK